jgi:hypothetical protein
MRSARARVASRRALLAHLMLTGTNVATELQTKLEEMGFQISLNTVHTDIRHVFEAWKTSAIHDMGAARAMECEKISRVEAEAWAGWERSKRDMTRTRRRKVISYEGLDSEDASGVECEEVHTDTLLRDGDPRFLAVIDNCIKRRCALLGLDADMLGGNDDDGGAGDTSALVALAALVERLRTRRDTTGPGAAGDVSAVPTVIDGGRWIESRPVASESSPEGTIQHADAL